MPFKAPESYELDRPNPPFLDRPSTDSDLSELQEFDPLRHSHRRYTDDASQPLRSIFDSEKNLSFAERPLAWLIERRRRRTWLPCWGPSRFGCMLLALFAATLTLLVSAGGLWIYKVGGVPADGESEPWYPTPHGGTVDTWRESYRKAAELVRQMSVVEKVNITTGTGWSMGPCVGNTGQVDRLAFPSLCLQDGPLGLRFVDNASSFPAGITVGATWNKDLMYQRGKAHGLEARLKGINVLLGPSMGPLGRLPAGGRNWEGFGSDPVLQAIAASCTIRGIQDTGVIATAKHFVGNEQEHFRQSWEWGTPNAISSNIDDRTLHEFYAWPFAESIRAGVGSVMCSYNQVNNSYACQNSKLMNGILKDELGFQGFIQSDWLAQRSGVASALAGLDMSMPGDGLKWQDGKSLWGSALTQATLNGSIPIERLDDMVLRVVAAWYQLGQDNKERWSNKSLSSSATFSSWTDEETGKLHPGSPDDDERGVVNRFVPVRNTREGGDHDALARDIAAEGIVMVKNEDQTLPLEKDGSNIRRSSRAPHPTEKTQIGIFGEDAFANPRGPNVCPDRGCNEFTLASGWGSGASDFPHLIAPFDALNATFTHSAVDIAAYQNQTTGDAGRGAKDQDLCIVFANSDAGEGYLKWESIQGDRNDLRTQKHGDTLIAEVARKCGQARGSAAPTIVVLHTVGPVILEKWIELPGVKAVLIAHLPGQESGNALVDVIFGHVNPSGHLPYTIAKDEDDYGPTSKILTMPNHLVPQQNFTEGLYVDYRYFDKHNVQPRYEFGYGLSYTKFQLSLLVVSSLGPKGAMPARRKNGLEPPQVNSTVPDAADVVAPEGFRKLQKYIYPYLERAADGGGKTGTPDYPPGYDPQHPHAISPAGGGEGGNPDLYTPAVSVEASVMNLGHVAGAAVVQLYIGFPANVRDVDGVAVDFPIKVLRGFEKVTVGIDEGEKRKKVQFKLTRKDLSYWDVKAQNWIMPKGEYTVWLGFSSRDLAERMSFDPFA